jgi:phytoene dehydrogenase-like protein
MKQIAIIGGGHNGLVAAFYLARAGHKPIVLEQRSVVGGSALTDELVPGFRCPTLAHATGPLRPSIVRDMHLQKRVEFLRPDPRLVALSPNGRAIVFCNDHARTVEGLRAHSSADAAIYLEFCGVLERLGAFLLPILERTPPSLDGPAPGEMWELLKTGRRFRKLGRQDAYRLLRWMPMAVADLVGEWFSTDLLQAAVAARAIFGSASGPWSAGTGAALLLNAATDPAPGGGTVTVKGGPGALAHGLAEAAREAGATIRVDAPVAQVLVRDGHTTGVRLADGSEVPADAVVSNADPRRTLLELVDPVELDPGFLQRIRNYRMPGTVAKVNIALSGLPQFAGVANPAELHGRLHVAPSVDYLEKAFDASKYGEFSSEPYLDITIPSLLDPALCPPGGHVMSVVVQFAPYKLANNVDWRMLRDSLGTTVLRTLERYAPGLSRMVEHRQVLSPADLELTYGYTRGHILHGEPALDQLFTMRPLLGWSQYQTPIQGLFLCGAGTHPGGGMTGAPGRNAAREIAKAIKNMKPRIEAQPGS